MLENLTIEGSNFVTNTLFEIDLLLQNYVFNGFAALSNYLKIPLGIIATIYIVILGYSIMLGWVKTSMSHFIKTTLKIGFIYMAVTQWAWVSQNFIDLINGLINELGSELISASPTHIPGGDNINNAMQIVLNQFTKLGTIVFQIGGFNNMGAWLDGILLWMFGYTLVGLALLEIIVAKVLLALLFVLTPLIALFYFFKPFHGIVDRWLSAIISAALLQLLITATLTFALSLAYWWLQIHNGQSALQIGNAGVLPIIILGIICVGLLWKSAELAYILGGSVNTSFISLQIANGLADSLNNAINKINAAPFHPPTAKDFIPTPTGATGMATFKATQTSLRQGE
ncbi:MAG: hypothetical protein A3E87_06605 [Gammaproteobacteria bacterium RIFCSPHIGHO2_12_FULL_35_23]|nr:MAG: hypothetical protein A3E87_06605 [Gammaproteobacteria bacterium RIFCSPHIGHO2_12_FULL_35_23]